MTVGVVLGAGGPLGWAFHLGVIEGVRSAINREPANADRIVGTSAGAAIAAAVVGGATTDDVLEAIDISPTADERELMRSAGAEALRHPLRSLRPLAPNLLANARRTGLTTASVGLLPAGLFPTVPLRRFVAAGSSVWPAQLWVPSVRIDDGKVVVFGRDPIDISVADAIEATSAVPGVFTPKVHDGYRYVDGAVASATHANILADEGHDVVLISSPMTRSGRGLIRARARRHLNAELAVLHAHGIRTIVVSPSDAVVAAAEGFPRRNPANGLAIVEAARNQTISAFADLGRVPATQRQ